MKDPDGSGEDPESDGQLAAMAASGDAAAFSRLIERHYDRFYRLAWRWCGQRAEAEDITQDVCVKIARAIRGWRGEAAFTTWAYRIVYTTTVDRVRAGRRLMLVEPMGMMALRETSDIASGAAQERPAADVHVLHGELWAEVRRLPGQQRDAVLLVYGEDMSHAEAALIMGCSEKTVSWHLHEAKKRLRAAFDAVG